MAVSVIDLSRLRQPAVVSMRTDTNGPMMRLYGFCARGEGYFSELMVRDMLLPSTLRKKTDFSLVFPQESAATMRWSSFLPPHRRRRLQFTACRFRSRVGLLGCRPIDTPGSAVLFRESLRGARGRGDGLRLARNASRSRHRSRALSPLLRQGLRVPGVGDATAAHLRHAVRSQALPRQGDASGARAFVRRILRGIGVYLQQVRVAALDARILRPPDVTAIAPGHFVACHFPA